MNKTLTLSVLLCALGLGMSTSSLGASSGTTQSDTHPSTPTLDNGRDSDDSMPGQGDILPPDDSDRTPGKAGGAIILPGTRSNDATDPDDDSDATAIPGDNDDDEDDR